MTFSDLRAMEFPFKGTIRPSWDDALASAMWSKGAYFGQDAMRALAESWGLEVVRFLGFNSDGSDKGSTQGVILRSFSAAIIAFRGTQVDSLEDVLIDLRFLKVEFDPYSDSAGKAHGGILEAYREVEEDVQEAVCTETDNLDVLLCGHSLAGGIGQVCLSILLDQGIKAHGYFFGSPRVWDSNSAECLFRATFKDRLLVQFANRHDPIVRLAPEVTGASHVNGVTTLFGESGIPESGSSPWNSHRQANPVDAEGFLAGLWRPEFRDHAIDEYVRLVKQAREKGYEL